MATDPNKNLQEEFNLELTLDELLEQTSEIFAKQHLSEVEVQRIIEASEYKHPD